GSRSAGKLAIWTADRLEAAQEKHEMETGRPRPVSNTLCFDRNSSISRMRHATAPHWSKKARSGPTGLQLLYRWKGNSAMNFLKPFAGFMLFLTVLASLTSAAQQQVIPLYPGVAPGSEGWTRKEATA